MKKAGRKQVETAEPGSWKSIKQKVGGGVVTGSAKRRSRARLVRITSWLALVVVVIGGIGFGVRQLDRVPESVGSAVQANPIEEIVLLTDGVLSDEWINRRLQIPPETGLMEVDIQAIKARLEAEGQVAAATISRRFPSTLVVSLHERSPVARLVTRAADDRRVVFLVGMDGVVYQGFGYEPDLIDRIPYLDGIRLVRSGEGFRPLPRLDDVAALYSLAEQIAPHLVTQWRIVSLDRRPFIVIRTAEVNEIIFEPGSYRQQLARLDYILDFYRQMPDERPARIDLSFKNQAAVELAADGNFNTTSGN